MLTGQFIDFDLPFITGGNYVSPTTQATSILVKAQALISAGAPGVAITYSANYNQTVVIQTTYASGGWDTHTVGGNQAQVITAMETLMGSTYQSLQGKMHILPITTMNGNITPLPNWTENLHMSILVVDLSRVNQYILNGWSVLAWQNQITVTNPTAPYAIGGGIAGKAAPVIGNTVQQSMLGFAQQYGV